MIDILGTCILFSYLVCMLIITQLKQDTSIANFTWGGGVLLLTWYTFLRYSSFLPLQIIITTFISLWASRLILHIYKRYTGKDPRFSTWKWQGFKALIINFCWIFGQTIMIAIMSFSSVFINIQETIHVVPFLQWMGLLLWIFGFVYEAISDYQLAQFMKNPANKGRVMRYGLWRYSRHPNYFGEILMWWGIYCLMASVLAAIPVKPLLHWLAVIPPITITVLLIFVTGIPWIEKAMANNPEYQEYKQTTSALIPWFTKN